MKKDEFALVGGKDFLVLGAGMIVEAMLVRSLFLPLLVVGTVSYVAGLYLWGVDVDSRPLKLFAIEMVLLISALLILRPWQRSWSLWY